jgi:phosphoribulokinase
MRDRMAAAEDAGQKELSHFGPDASLRPDMAALFQGYGESGSGQSHLYLHDNVETAPFTQDPGTFTE